jgi:hypothetical protein
VPPWACVPRPPRAAESQVVVNGCAGCRGIRVVPPSSFPAPRLAGDTGGILPPKRGRDALGTAPPRWGGITRKRLHPAMSGRDLGYAEQPAPGVPRKYSHTLCWSNVERDGAFCYHDLWQGLSTLRLPRQTEQGGPWTTSLNRAASSDEVRLFRVPPMKWRCPRTRSDQPP